MKILVSVRDLPEARLAARGGANFIDLKEPGAGALGGLPVARIRPIVAGLRSLHASLPISATIGDLPTRERLAIAQAVEAVGACGVDVVKVGIERVGSAGDLLEMLAACGRPVVPVFIADHGIDMAQVRKACALGFPGVMVDTADKHAGSLFDALPTSLLRRFVDTVRAAGALVGVAGALRLSHAPLLQALAPDFAGFRSAVCAGDRSGALDAALLRRLCEAMGASSALTPP